MKFDESLKARIDKVRMLVSSALAGKGGSQATSEAASLAQSILYDTVGNAHPNALSLEKAIEAGRFGTAIGICQTVITLYDQGALKSPRLTIAHEIEGDILDIAQTQTQAAEKSVDNTQKQTQLGIAAFLTGASLEDALRRLCDASQITYDSQKSTISKLQSALYQPAKQIEVISSSENKQITSWGDTRNKADHGKFEEITVTEVAAMIMGVRSFIDKHLS